MSLYLRWHAADGRRKRSKAKRKTQHFLFTRFFLLTACFLSVLVGCDESFQPIKNSEDTPFSMYGYLDATADTQLVRVTPLREQIHQTPEKPEMHVTLEHLESGNISVMHDTLFDLRQGFNALAVWTTMDVEPEQTYRLKAERPDGAASQVTVTTPSDFPTPVLKTIGPYEGTGTLLIKEVEKLADVVNVWKIRDEISLIAYRHEGTEQDYLIPEGYDYSYDMNAYWDIRKILDPPYPIVQDLLASGIVTRQVFVAAGGPEWLEEIPTLSDEVYALPEGVSNVENGAGYVIGIVSKTIPFTNCRNEQKEDIGCPLVKPMFR